MNQLWSLHDCEKKGVIPLFTPIRYLILLKMAGYFLRSNNAKYAVPS